MRQVTSRVRAAIGAAAVIVCAVPATARAQQAPNQARVEARWFDGRGPARPLIRWRMARARTAAVAWRMGYARGFVAGRFGPGFGPRRSWAREFHRAPYDGRRMWGMRAGWRRPI